MANNSSIITCQIEDVYSFSSTCLEDPTSNRSSCFPEINSTLKSFAFVWCIINAIFGIGGNLLTIFAISFAAYKKKFRLHDNWYTTTIFVLNLAFNDLLYCSVNLPLYANQYLKGKSDHVGLQYCFATAAFRYINAFCDWMTLGIIALSRCVILVNRDFGRRMNTRAFGISCIVFIWFYANILFLPIYSEDTFNFGTIGYNCRFGKCDFISQNSTLVNPHIFFYGIGFSFPCFMIIASYFCIWSHVKATRSEMRSNMVKTNNKDLKNADLKLTWTILMVCFCYFIFVLPITLMNMADPNANHLNLHIVAFCIYWMQYSLNFLVYAGKSQQYKQAYLYFMYTVTGGIFPNKFIIETTAASKGMSLSPTVVFIKKKENSNY